MQQFITSDGLGLEIAGIVLAVLSFTGATNKIERGIAFLRDWIKSFTPVLRGGLGDFFPTPQNLKRFGVSSLWTAFVTFLVTGFALYADPASRDWLTSNIDTMMRFERWQLIALALASPVLMYAAVNFVGFIAGAAMYVGFSAVWLVFWGLSRPPSGVMGSIGLAIALAGPAMKALNGA